MLKKLLVWSVVLLIVAALLAVPAFAQVANPTVNWGGSDFLTNEFGDINGDMTPFCESVPSSAQSGWKNMFPDLGVLCSW